VYFESLMMSSSTFLETCSTVSLTATTSAMSFLSPSH
jgi:hypothetical protein